MPRLTVMPHGINGGFPGGNKGKAGLRSSSKGWSIQSARRNCRFLMSVDGSLLPRLGLAVTLTVKRNPATSEEWSRLIDRLRVWARRRGVVLDHWVTEWTKAGRPHLHMCLFFDKPSDWFEYDIVDKWLEMTAHLETQSQGQYCVRINNLTGWISYVAKHAGRGYAHYQRERDNLPEGWQKTGSMWGKSQGWPTIEDGFDVDRKAWFALRRMMRGYLVAEARCGLSRAVRFGDEKLAVSLKKSLSFRRRMHSRGDRQSGEIQGFSEWVPYEVSRRMILHVATRGPVSVVPVGETPPRPF